MDNIFEIEQIKNDLYRAILRMNECINQMLAVQKQKPDDYNIDETYLEVERNWCIAYGRAMGFCHVLHHLTGEHEAVILRDAEDYIDSFSN